MKKKEKNTSAPTAEIIYVDDGRLLVWKRFIKRQKRFNSIVAVALIVLGYKIYYKNKEREQ